MGNKQSTRDKAERNERQSDAQQASKKIQQKIQINEKDMYGGYASKEASRFIGDQPASKGYYMTTDDGKKILDSNNMPILTSRGYKLKYGNSGAMGIGEKSIMGSVPISERMFEQQRKMKMTMLGGLSVFAGPIGGTIMRAGAADAYNSKYSDYQKSFKANMSSGKDFASHVNNQTNVWGQPTETANLAMGDTTEVASNKKNKSKTTKSTSKYFAGTGQDESNQKRTFYS
jgi:hypothetical protein